MMPAIMTLVLIAILWAIYKFFFADSIGSVATALPDELKNATIWMKEKGFEISGDIPLIGKMDEAFLLPSGMIVLSDTKSRKRKVVYESDILQVSGYKVLVEDATGKSVADYGFVRLLTPEGNAYFRVKLLSRVEVSSARQLHEDLVSGLYEGEKCGKQYICNTCAYQRECEKLG